MIQIKEFVNSIFSSKTYLLSKKGYNKAWLVDIGDIVPVEAYLNANHLTVEGVFVTHAHFDHIYGLESLVELYPKCRVFVTEYSKLSLASDKLNLSRYHGSRINYSNDNVVVVHEGENCILFNEEPPLYFFETPGHNPGCLTMITGDLVFTGDAYIPGIQTNTQLPHANKEMAMKSIDRIIDFSEGKKIYPGHLINNIKT